MVQRIAEWRKRMIYWLLIRELVRGSEIHDPLCLTELSTCISMDKVVAISSTSRIDELFTLSSSIVVRIASLGFEAIESRDGRRFITDVVCLQGILHCSRSGEVDDSGRRAVSDTVDCTIEVILVASTASIDELLTVLGLGVEKKTSEIRVTGSGCLIL
jgi:hypothetical protein